MVALSQRFSDVAMRRSRSVLLAHGGDDQIVLYVDSAPGRSAVGPRPPTWAQQQVGGYLGYSGRGADAFGKAARDPQRTFRHKCGSHITRADRAVPWRPAG